MNKVITSEMWFIFTLLFILYLGLVLIVLLIIRARENKLADNNIWSAHCFEFKYTKVPSGKYHINLKKNELINCDSLTRYHIYIEDLYDFAFVAKRFDLDSDGDFIYISSDKDGRIKKLYNYWELDRNGYIITCSKRYD